MKGAQNSQKLFHRTSSNSLKSKLDPGSKAWDDCSQDNQANNLRRAQHGVSHTSESVHVNF